MKSGFKARERSRQFSGPSSKGGPESKKVGPGPAGMRKAGINPKMKLESVKKGGKMC